MARMRIDERNSTLQCLENAKKRFKTGDVKCTKYNYSLEEIVQNFSTYEGFIQLSEDSKKLIITCKKPIDNQKYVLEADPNTIEEIKENELKLQ